MNDQEIDAGEVVNVLCERIAKLEYQLALYQARDRQAQREAANGPADG